MKILGIESSCDETACAVVEGSRILASLVATQHDVHEKYGGVVPELASRRHIENIVPLVSGALDKAQVTLDGIDGIAVTNAPGLLGSLLVGLSAAKSIAYARRIPFIGVNHLEGHLNAATLEFGEVPTPYVALVASGGHTSLYLVSGFGEYKLLGATRDDAAGEAFDKVAKLLDLGYPGGPAIDRISGKGDPRAVKFTKPRFDKDDSLDFSFSGIKTACLLRKREAEKKGELTDKFVADLAASFQETVVQILVGRLMDAAKRYDAKALVLAGGVAANRRLRAHLAEAAKLAGIPPFIPSMDLCTDNAAMIAYVGGRHLELGHRSDLALNAIANQEIGITI